ncbi:MAG: hypothetical protein WDW36_009232 [Sanguina aurantia]
MEVEEPQHRDLFGSDSDEDAPAQAPNSSSAPPLSSQGNDPNLEDDLEDADGAATNGNGASGMADEPGEASDNDEAAVPTLGPPQYLAAPLLAVPPAGSISLLKMTNILGIEPHPFSRETYEDEGDVYVDEQGKNRVKLKDQCCMRWRVTRDEDGTEGKESNARFVRWSDGSLQLLMGEEVLDVVQQDVAKQNAYLFAVGQVIQGQAAITSRLAFQPASLQSKLHQRLSEVVDKRHTKTQKVARMVGLDNPEMDLLKREKLEEDKIKNRRQLQQKSERVMNRSAYPAQPRQRPQPGLNANYLEQDDALDGDEDDFIDDDDEEDGGPGSQRGRGGSQRGGPASLRRPQMDDEEAEEAAARRLSSAKRPAPAGANRAGNKKQQRKRDSDDASSSGAEEVEDGEEGTVQRKAKQVKARRGVVLSDEDEDDE